MKRILLGAVTLAVLMGLGAGGMYYAQRALLYGDAVADSKTEQSDEPETLPVAPRDLTPTPIPLANAEDQSAAPADPFMGNSAAAPRATAYDAGIEPTYPDASQRYADNSADAPADDIPDAEVAADDVAEADVADSDIPDADHLPPTTALVPVSRPPGMAAPPDRHRDLDARYPERQAVAEVDEPDPLDEPVAADAAAAAPAEKAARDRYGRPLQQSASAHHQPQASPAPLDARTAEPAARRLTPAALPAEQSSPKHGAGEERGDTANGVADQGQAQEMPDEGTGRPGDPRLSGSQTPTLTIEKTAPPEIQIGKPARFLIKVRNTGSVTAQGVEIHDAIPQGTQFIEATPPAKRGEDGALVWDLGPVKTGEERTVELQLMPTAEGEIGSVATLHFRAEASVRTLATKPMLHLDVSGPDHVMKGQQVNLRIKITNPGTGAATGILLSEIVPEGLSHPAGQELELDIGTLKPGESRDLELALAAAEAGTVTNVVTAKAEGNLQAEAQTEIEIIAPQIQVEMTGPKRRYLERNATHNISVSNPGTAPARDIELVAVLPKELQFVQANNGGQFDAATRSVYWSLEELPPQETGTVELTTLPLTAGEAKLLLKGTAQQNLADQREEVVAIEGLAAISFQLSDVSDPIEVGGETTYEIRVVNQGSKAATGVRLVALVPAEMKPVSAEGPVRYTVEGGRVLFEPLKQLAPKADTVYKVKVQAVAAGDLRLQVQVSTDEMPDPVTKEESTRVFGDE